MVIHDLHGGQDQEHGEVHLDHHVNVLGVPGVRKVAARIEMSIFIIDIFVKLSANCQHRKKLVSRFCEVVARVAFESTTRVLYVTINSGSGYYSCIASQFSLYLNL